MICSINGYNKGDPSLFFNISSNTYANYSYRFPYEASCSSFSHFIKPEDNIIALDFLSNIKPAFYGAQTAGKLFVWNLTTPSKGILYQRGTNNQISSSSQYKLNAIEYQIKPNVIGTETISFTGITMTGHSCKSDMIIYICGVNCPTCYYSSNSGEEYCQLCYDGYFFYKDSQDQQTCKRIDNMPTNSYYDDEEH